MFNASSDFYFTITADLNTQSIQWTFIPPNTSHCGGLWEAGVRFRKHYLKRVIGDRVLTFEELSTVLAKIEACLNSRPLCPLTSDPDDLNVLIPRHFLCVESLSLIPKEEHRQGPEHRLARYRDTPTPHRTSQPALPALFSACFLLFDGPLYA